MRRSISRLIEWVVLLSPVELVAIALFLATVGVWAISIDTVLRWR